VYYNNITRSLTFVRKTHLVNENGGLGPLVFFHQRSSIILLQSTNHVDISCTHDFMFMNGRENSPITL